MNEKRTKQKSRKNNNPNIFILYINLSHRSRTYEKGSKPIH